MQGFFGLSENGCKFWVLEKSRHPHGQSSYPVSHFLIGEGKEISLKLLSSYAFHRRKSTHLTYKKNPPKFVVGQITAISNFQKI